MPAKFRMRYVLAVGTGLYVAMACWMYGGWPFSRQSVAHPRHDVAVVFVSLNCLSTLGMLACTVSQVIRFARCSSLKFSMASLLHAVTCVAAVLAMSHWDVWFHDVPPTPADEKLDLEPVMVVFSPTLHCFSSNSCNPWGVEKFFLHDFPVLFGLGCMAATFLDLGIMLAKRCLRPAAPGAPAPDMTETE